jgi:TPR repeat protein
MRILIALMMMLLLAGVSQAETDSLNEAQRAQEAGDYARAVTLLLPLAKKGNPVAQFNLGVLYTQGLIIQQNYPVAVQWYLAAAEKGHAEAQANLGQLYKIGMGVPQDFKKAMHWLALAARQGNSSAQLHLGQMYAAGLGVTQDDKEALKWYHLAADQGNAIAHAQLGECYENGQGVAQDSIAASKWLSTAANNAGDQSSRNTYLTRRDEIEKGNANRQLALAQQLARIEAERVKAEDAARADAARIKAEQAAFAHAAEQARQKAAAQAALDAQIQARKLADIEEKSARLKAKQGVKAERKTAAARRRSELETEMARRRAEINAEAGRRKRQILAEARYAKSVKTSYTKPARSDKPMTPEDALIHEHPPMVRSETNPVKERLTRGKAETVIEQRQATGPIRVSGHSKKRYPAKVELTDEELEHPLMHEPQAPGTTGSGRTSIKLKQIEWSKKQDDS